jgi:hypothetical protein
VNEAELARWRATPKNAEWILWASLQIGILLFLGIAAVVTTMAGHGLVGGGSSPILAAIDVVFSLAAVVPILAGLFLYTRLVARGPAPNGRSARRLSARLLEAKAASDPDRFAADTVLVIDANFRGASILSWAIGEAGALLAGIYSVLRGFQPAGVGLIVLWFAGMAFSAPRPARRDGYRRRALAAAGLDDAQVEKLLASVEAPIPH